MIDHHAIRTGAIAWSGEDLALVFERARGAEEALHLAAARSRELGHDTETAMAHGMRLFAITDFLRPPRPPVRDRPPTAE